MLIKLQLVVKKNILLRRTVSRPAVFEFPWFPHWLCDLPFDPLLLFVRGDLASKGNLRGGTVNGIALENSQVRDTIDVAEVNVSGNVCVGSKEMINLSCLAADSRNGQCKTQTADCHYRWRSSCWSGFYTSSSPGVSK